MQGLSTEDYRQVMTVVEQAILSTDLAGYFTKKEKFVEAADGGEIAWQVRIKLLWLILYNADKQNCVFFTTQRLNFKNFLV